MYIDIHIHIRTIPRPLVNGEMRDSTPERVIKRYDELGIDRGVVLPSTGANERAVELFRDYPGRFIPFCNISPRAYHNDPHAPLGRFIKFYKDLGCKGIGEVTENLPFNDPMVENLFSHCQDQEIPLIFHVSPTIGGAYGLYDEPGLPLLEGALRKFPELIFLGHSQPFWAEIAVLDTIGSRAHYPRGKFEEEGAVPKLMRKYPNLHGDLSAGSGYNALSRDPEYGYRFLEEFQDRLYFGTDGVGIYAQPESPPPLMEFLETGKKEDKISKECFEKVTHKNAIDLLGLDI